VAKRAGTLTSAQEKAQTRPSPNAEVPWITVEVRAHWPRGFENKARAKEMLRELFDKAIADIDAAEPAAPKTHPESTRDDRAN
jgi:hypothetical protein